MHMAAQWLQCGAPVLVASVVSVAQASFPLPLPRAPLPTHSQPHPCLFSLPILTKEALVLEPPGAETAEVLLTPRRRDSGWTASTRLVDLAKRACSRRSQADALPLRLIFRLAKTLVTYPRMDSYSRALCLSLCGRGQMQEYTLRETILNSATFSRSSPPPPKGCATWRLWTCRQGPC